MSPIDWKEILTQVQALATSGSARMNIAATQAFDSPAAAEGRLQDVLDAQTVLASGPRPFMESLDLFEPWYLRLSKKAVLKTLELRDVRSFCLEVVALNEVLRSSSTRWATQARERLLRAEEPLSAIDQILTPRGEIRSDASETLFRLFKEKESLGRQIESTLDKLVNDHQMQGYLQDRYVTTREGRWVLPVRSGSRHSVDGVIHGSSQTKQTVFMEPDAVIPLNNRLRQAEVEIEEEIERLLTQLSEYLATQTIGFSESRRVLLEADELFAVAQWSTRVEAKPFCFTDGEIFLVDVCHPLLVFQGKNPVRNTVHLNQDRRVLLLSGPNAGGKTVLLKSIGLASEMARCGYPICASDESRLPYFKKIIVGIGDAQSVDQDLSTFAAHLKLLEAASESGGPDQLILIDEICGSTDPDEGSALARAFIESFASQGSFGVITSHLGPLKIGWEESSKVLNGSLEYDSHTGRPTYQFIQGVAGDSLALQTARRVGIRKQIIDRAVSFLSPEFRHRLSALDQLDQMKSDLQTLQTHLRKEQNRAQFEKEKYEKLREQLEKEKADLLEKAVRSAQKQIDELVAQAKVEEVFKKHRSLQDVKQKLPEIVKAKAGVSTTAPLLQTNEDFAKTCPPGTKVFVPSLNQDGLIQSLPNAKGEVLVLANSIRLMLPWRDLRPPSVQQNPTAQLVRRATPLSVALQESERVIDLRGKSTEEALKELESQIDRAMANGEDRLKIVHGHGTEALKKSLRAYLSRSVQIKKWKAGSPEQGGDGTTWAELSDEPAE